MKTSFLVYAVLNTASIFFAFGLRVASAADAPVPNGSDANGTSAEHVRVEQRLQPAATVSVPGQINLGTLSNDPDAPKILKALVSRLDELGFKPVVNTTGGKKPGIAAVAIDGPISDISGLADTAPQPTSPIARVQKRPGGTGDEVLVIRGPSLTPFILGATAGTSPDAAKLSSFSMTADLDEREDKAYPIDFVLTAKDMSGASGGRVAHLYATSVKDLLELIGVADLRPLFVLARSSFDKDVLRSALLIPTDTLGNESSIGQFIETRLANANINVLPKIDLTWSGNSNDAIRLCTALGRRSVIAWNVTSRELAGNFGFNSYRSDVALSSFDCLARTPGPSSVGHGSITAPINTPTTLITIGGLAKISFPNLVWNPSIALIAANASNLFANGGSQTDNGQRLRAESIIRATNQAVDRLCDSLRAPGKVGTSDDGGTTADSRLRATSRSCYQARLEDDKVALAQQTAGEPGIYVACSKPAGSSTVAVCPLPTDAAKKSTDEKPPSPTVGYVTYSLGMDRFVAKVTDSEALAKARKFKPHDRTNARIQGALAAGGVSYNGARRWHFDSSTVRFVDEQDQNCNKPISYVNANADLIAVMLPGGKWCPWDAVFESFSDTAPLAPLSDSSVHAAKATKIPAKKMTSKKHGTR